jgi:hypothetical protein
MRRQWFKDKDGTFYRNCNLNLDERERALRSGRLFLVHRLEKEWSQLWQKGLISKEKLGWRDVEVQPRPFREAYPDQPVLWALDENP